MKLEDRENFKEKMEEAIAKGKRINFENVPEKIKQCYCAFYDQGCREPCEIIVKLGDCGLAMCKYHASRFRTKAVAS